MIEPVGRTRQDSTSVKLTNMAVKAPALEEDELSHGSATAQVTFGIARDAGDWRTAAQALSQIHAGQSWRSFGFGSWNEYVASINMSTSHAHKLVAIGRAQVDAPSLRQAYRLASKPRHEIRSEATHRRHAGGRVATHDEAGPGLTVASSHEDLTPLDVNEMLRDLLTDREIVAVKLTMQQFTEAEIADILCLTRQAVREALKRARIKLTPALAA